MPLQNEAQYTLLNTDITVTNQVEFATYVANNNDQAIANAYNLDANPQYWVWRTKVLKTDIYQKASVDGTTWNWTEYINRSAAEKAAWQEMFDNPDLAFNPSLPSVQQGLQDIFSGASSAGQRMHIRTFCRKLARRIERLLLNGSGTGTTTNPGTLVYEGTIDGRDVGHALRGVPL